MFPSSVITASWGTKVFLDVMRLKDGAEAPYIYRYDGEGNVAFDEKARAVKVLSFLAASNDGVLQPVIQFAVDVQELVHPAAFVLTTPLPNVRDVRLSIIVEREDAPAVYATLDERNFAIRQESEPEGEATAQDGYGPIGSWVSQQAPCLGYGSLYWYPVGVLCDERVTGPIYGEGFADLHLVCNARIVQPGDPCTPVMDGTRGGYRNHQPSGAHGSVTPQYIQAHTTIRAGCFIPDQASMVEGQAVDTSILDGGATFYGYYQMHTRLTRENSADVDYRCRPKPQPGSGLMFYEKTYECITDWLTQRYCKTDNVQVNFRKNIVWHLGFLYILDNEAYSTGGGKRPGEGFYDGASGADIRVRTVKLGFFEDNAVLPSLEAQR